MATAGILPLPKLSPIAAAIKALYGAAVDLNEFFDHHLERMKRSRHAGVARSGRVLAAAKEGFGIGFISSATLIAAGQLLLGNPLAAGKTVATTTTLSNPYVMTAAALGAVIYGYSALTDEERQDLHSRLARGLDIGVELVKSIVQFARETAKKLLTDENLDELKQYVRQTAALFGRSLGDITRRVKDRVSDGIGTLKETVGDAGKTLSGSGKVARERAEDVADVIADVVGQAKRKARRRMPALPAPQVSRTSR